MTSARPIAAVTGASSGIGAVFARKLAARGYDLVLIARRKERLDELAAELGREHGCSAESLVADLSMEPDTERVAGHLRSTAGLAISSTMQVSASLDDFTPPGRRPRTRCAVCHVMATVRLTHAVLKQMVDRNAGSIINVASVAAFACSEGNVSYCATKNWMATFSEGLFLEMKSVAPGVGVFKPFARDLHIPSSTMLLAWTARRSPVVVDECRLCSRWLSPWPRTQLPLRCSGLALSSFWLPF